MTNTRGELLNDGQLDEVVGGSWRIPEDGGKKAGLSLRKSDGSPGSWGYLWNSGDYFWRGNKVSDGDAYDIYIFTYHNDRQPHSVKEANDFVKSIEQDDNIYNP